MSADENALLSRAAAVIENARNVRTETRRLINVGDLQRLERELFRKMYQIETLTARPRDLPSATRLH